MSFAVLRRLTCVRWVLGSSLSREDVPGLCERLRASLQNGDEVVVCDLSAVTEPDAVTIEALARLQLTALRIGRRIRIEGASPRLAQLLALTGLDGLLSEPARLGLESRRQAEQREQPLGLEE